MSQATRVVVLGAAGRMGQELVTASIEAEGVALHAAVQYPGHPALGREVAPGLTLRGSLPEALQGADVLIDFTAPQASLEALALAADAGVAAVIGTTGLDDAQRRELEALAQRTPVVFAPNMSVGVNAMLGLLRMAAQVLEGYDLEVFEMHHRHKVDAPSGTALRLAEVLCEARGVSPQEALRHGRHGVAPRQPGEIGMQVLRGGDVAGEHTVFFLGQGERLEITHKASSRAVFAQGAVRAARWLHGQPAGLYGMAQVLGLPG